MACILFLPWPLASHGTASLKLARSLQGAGHDIVYVNIGQDDPRYAQNGFRSIVVLRELLPDGLLGVFRGYTGRRLDKALRRALPGYLAALDEALEAVVHEYRPALAVMDRVLAYTALQFHRHAVQSLLLFTILPLDREPGMPPLMSRHAPPRNAFERGRNRVSWAATLVRARWRNHRNGLAKAYRSLAASSGFPVARTRRDGQFGPEPEMLQVITCPQCFEFAPASKPYRHFIGPCIDLERKECDFDWSLIRPDSRLAYCALGTRNYGPALAFYERVMQAFAALEGWQVVVAAGDCAPALAPRQAGAGASNVVLVRDAPQLAMLRRAHVMLGHGGLGSVKECIYFGVPMVIFPAADDQFGNGARVAYHRLGEVGRLRHSTPDEIRALVTRVAASGEIKSSLEMMRRRFVDAEREPSILDIVGRALQAQIARPAQFANGLDPT